MNDKIDHSQMNLDQLQNAHSNMLATASDLGFQPPDDTLVEIESVEQGRGVCDALHEAITKFRAGIDAEDEAKHGDGASDGDSDAGKKPTKKRRTAAKGVASAKKSRQGAPPEENKENNQMAGTDEKKVKKAKKVAAAPTKKAKTAKKAAAPAKKAPTNGAATKAAAFDDNAKITWTYKGEGTGCRGARHERVELVRKANGKTVKTYLANGGRADTLRNAVKDGKAKVA